MEPQEEDANVDTDVASSEDGTSNSETELMVKSRARRTTAGNRYSTLVAQEEAAAEDEEDEVAMLFAEAEGEDEDFNSDDGDDDADMSSSDDDDQGPNTAADDLDGEKEIEKEAKAERARKRKADMALTTTTGLRKKPKIDPTALRRAPAAKPSKRKERVSWLPDSDAAPGRTSLRKQTILHRAETHAKLKENEEQRLKMKARREKRVRERQAEAPKEMTQTDRLAEAERVERRNAKSLNRWEAMEKKRAEEQAARLAALRERKLEGAVVTLYSSRATYIGLKEHKDNESEAPPEHKKRGRKPKALLEKLAAAKLANAELSMASASQKSADGLGATATSTNVQPAVSSPNVNTGTQPKMESVNIPISGSPATEPVEQVHTAEEQSKSATHSRPNEDSQNDFLTGIHEYASMQTEAKLKDGPAKSDVAVAASESATPKDDTVLNTSTERSSSTTKEVNSPAPSEPISAASKENGPDSALETSAMAPTHTTQAEQSAAGTAHDSSATNTQTINEISMANTGDPTDREGASVDVVLHNAARPTHDNNGDSRSIEETQQTQVQPLATGADASSIATTAPPAEPPVEVVSTRNLVILERFDDLSDESRHDFNLFYNNRKTMKPTKVSQELCPVTGLTARYRDPATGIGYANTAAYKKLQELQQHEFLWSSMLGCYVGRTNTVARGVPEGFLAR